MILTILEWTGTVLILSGIFFLASAKASNPKTRMKGLIITSIGCSILGMFAIIIVAYGVLATQVGVISINIWGIYNCKKEIRNELHAKN